MTQTPALATRCVHAGEIADPHGSPHTPLYATTTFKFPSTAALLDVERQNATAMKIAQAMQRHPAISRVLYPGLPDFPGHELAKQQMHGFGGMLTVEVKDGGATATRVADRLRLFALAPSLGGVESLVTQPCTTTHHGLAPEERARRGISDAMLRLSVGLEEADDLIADLMQALG
jgi:cystathionine gamma-synthase